MEVCRLIVFEDRILRRIFGPKRNKNGKWRKLDNEEILSLYHSPNLKAIKSRRIRWAGLVSRMKERRSAYKILTGKATGERP